MTAASEPAARVVPEPPDAPLGWLGFLNRIRENELAVFPRDAFLGDFGEARFFFRQYVLLNDPELIRHVLLTNATNYGKSPLTRRVLGPLLGQGLLTAEGEAWRRHRRIVAPAFQHDRLAALAEIMTECAAQRIATWQAAGPDEVRNIAEEMRTLTMEIATKALFSRDISETVPALGQALALVLERTGNLRLFDVLGLPEWLPRRRDGEVAEAMALIERTIQETVRERRANPGGAEDLLAHLLLARDEESGQGLTEG